MSLRIRRSLFALLLIPFAATCGGGGEPSDPVPAGFLLGAPVVPGSAPWGAMKNGEPFTVTAVVVDAHGDPVEAPGIPVQLAVTFGSALLTGTTSGITGEDGSVALPGLVLSGPTGPTQLAVTSEGLTSVWSPVFTLKAGAATSLVKVSGDSQSTTAGERSPAPVVVEVRDASGNPTPGVVVQVAVAVGNGMVDGQLSVTRPTGNDGRLVVEDWAMAPLVGPNAVDLSIPSRPAVPGVQFSAQSHHGAPHHTTFVTDWPSSAPVDTDLGTPVVATLRDNHGNPVAGAPIGWDVYGVPLPGDTITDSLGRAVLQGWHTPTTMAVYAIRTRLSVHDFPYGTLLLTVTAGPVARIAFYSDSAAIVPAGSDLYFQVRLTDQFGNPTIAQPVSWSIVSGPGLPGPQVLGVTPTASDGTVGAEIVVPAGKSGRSVLRATPVGLPDSTRDFTIDAVIPVALVVVAGDSQAVSAGDTLPLPLRVQVVDSAGVGVRGVPVRFDDTPEGVSIRSDAGGFVEAPPIVARATLTRYPLLARSPWIADSSATWTVLPHAGPPASLVLECCGGIPQGEVGQILGSMRGVRLRDRLGLPIQTGVVVFTPVDGSLDVDSVPIDPITGSARVVGWRLGTVAGMQHLIASHGALAPLELEAIARPGPTKTLTVVSSGAAEGYANERLGHGVVVEGHDRYGNLAVGNGIATSVASGDATPICCLVALSSAGRAYVDGWTLGAVGVPSVLRATSDSGIVEVTVTPTTPSPFQIVLRGVPAQYAAVFNRAAYDWRRRIVGDIPNLSVNIPAGLCVGFQPDVNETIDDVVIYVSITDIDGAGGILGSAGPCLIRTAGNLPLMGAMRFDVADAAALVADGTFGDVVLHEMGHVLGIGSLWTADNLLVNAGTINPQYTGVGGKLGWSEIGGPAATGGLATVPVENVGGPGTRDSHWREIIMPSELMTGYLSASVNPMSAVTIRSLADLGYLIDATTADPYTPLTAPSVEPGRRGVRIRDEVSAPRFTVDQNGKVRPIP